MVAFLLYLPLMDQCHKIRNTFCLRIQNCWNSLKGSCVSNRLAGAYQYEGDPLYDSLQILFNDPGVEGEFYPAFDVNELDQDYDEEVPFDMDAELDALQNATPSDFGSNG